jgi:hypothetical protein
MRFNDNIVMEGVSFLRTSDILTIITAVLIITVLVGDQLHV